MIAFVMRHGRQPLSEIESWTIEELFHWYDLTNKLVKEEIAAGALAL